MRNNLGEIMWRQRAILLVSLLFQVLQNVASNKHVCPPSSCGKISNISHPFRLKGDPKRCGNSRYELVCEDNVTVLYLYSAKYHVQAINYDNFTIRVMEPGLIQQPNCSSLPRFFLSQSNFTNNKDPYQPMPYRSWFSSNYSMEHTFRHIVFLKCINAVTDNTKYVDIASCDSKGYTYAVADLKAKEVEVGCHGMVVSPTSLWDFHTNTNNYSDTLIYKALAYGFEISWMEFACKELCGRYTHCYFNTTAQKLDCYPGCSTIPWLDGPKCGIREQLLAWAGIIITVAMYVILASWVCKYLFGVPLIIAFAIYKWRKRHVSLYEGIENYLEQNNLMSIRYSYKEIKKMGGGFKEKLGEGGYGSVFKGKLRSGPTVAIKMLNKSKGNGQDFINEITTIGRIHHHNIVQLIGFCVEGSKRYLVYEFMPNGSLDKIIFSKDGSVQLSYDKIYDISIGVARGISYLHYGCEMKILHFDIKPHNILLDENFIPKISDFGLAKLYPINNSIVTMTQVRGTRGYMAPELFYKNVGRISHKVDVYSFGMLLMEMTSKRKNLNPHEERLSQIYFPSWIYDHLEEERDIETEDITDEEKKIIKQMIIVALWCIQLNPNDRPSMNKVIEMLEGDIKSLKIPPRPTLTPHE
ncbi:hypothetical protein VNO78_30893 [Psophocarpus tetragonolobus]|uniref:Protein kinase domain-containing protein n=1 Tax=Psophocarpus tetragonolobus TaxID=3891 RepID=A0AAN9RY70_PSOTE